MSDARNIAPIPGAGKIAWIGTGVTLAAYLALMLAVAFDPDALRAPIAAGSTLSVGLIAGVLVIVLLVVASAAFTYWRNRITRTP